MPFQLRERTTIDLDGYGGGYSFHPAIQSYLYEVIYWDLDEENDDDPDVVGKVSVLIFYPRGYAYEELVDAADAINQNAYDAAEFFFGEEGPFGPHSDAISRDLMVVTNVTIQPEYRGQGLGHQVVQTLHRRHGRSLSMALLPCPLEEVEGGSPQKLYNYWHKLGFNRKDKETGWLWNDVTYRSEFPGRVR